MGSDIVKKSIRRRSLIVIVLGAFLSINSGMMFVGAIAIKDFSVMFFASLILLVLGIFIVWLGIKEGNLKTNGFIKRNPDLLNQADELYANIIYEDKFVIASQKHIGSKKVRTNIASFEEIIGMYLRKTRYNHLVTVQKELIIITRKGEMAVSIYSDLKRIDVMELVINNCPNELRIGYTPENLAYFKQQQALYKEINL